MINQGLFSSNTEIWATPQDFFDMLNEEFKFTLDPCALPENAKCEKFYTPEDDGLKQNWGGAKSFLQPSLWSQDSFLGREVLQRV